MALTKAKEFLKAQLEARRTTLTAEIAGLQILDNLNTEVAQIEDEIEVLDQPNRTRVEDFMVLSLGQRRSSILARIAEIQERPEILSELQGDLAEIETKLQGLEEDPPPTLPASVKVVFEGDSITAGGYWTTAMTYAPSGPAYTPQKIATAGIKAQEINIDYSTRAGAAYDASKELNILTLMAGTNDGAPTFPAEIYRRLRLIMRKARATGYRRLIGTLPSRNDDDDGFNANTLPLNLAIRSLYNSDLEANALFDFAASPLFDEASDADNQTYYSADQLHPNSTGQTALGNILGPVLASQIGTQGLLVVAPLSWSPWDLTNPHISLSNNNRTIARATTGIAAAQAKAFNGVIDTKIYWELVIDAPGDIYFGLCNRTFEPFLHSGFKALNNNVDAISCGDAGTGNIRYNSGASLGSIGAFQTGDVLRNCLDMAAQRWWVKRNAGNWNGNPTANPETGVAGIDVSGLGVGPIYPVGYLRQPGGQITSRFAMAEMDGPVPVGFGTFG